MLTVTYVTEFALIIVTSEALQQFGADMLVERLQIVSDNVDHLQVVGKRLLLQVFVKVQFELGEQEKVDAVGLHRLSSCTMSPIHKLC